MILTKHSGIRAHGIAEDGRISMLPSGDMSVYRQGEF